MSSSTRFRLRSAAIILRGDYVLLHRAEPDNFWTLPGGQIEIGESAQSALEREMLEELGAAVKVHNLAFVVENFFSHNAKVTHELGMYFLAEFESKSEYLNTSRSYRGIETSTNLEFKWFPKLELNAIELLPSFLPAELKNLSNSTANIVHKVVRNAL